MILSINRDHVPKQHYLADLCAGVELLYVCVWCDVCVWGVYVCRVCVYMCVVCVCVVCVCVWNCFCMQFPGPSYFRDLNRLIVLATESLLYRI